MSEREDVSERRFCVREKGCVREGVKGDIREVLVVVSEKEKSTRRSYLHKR